MRLQTLAASLLLASTEARLERYGRIEARELVAVGPGGSICPADVTITVQPIITGTETSFVTVTATVTDATTTSAGPLYTPPFSQGEGIPSGYITDLPFASFFFLAFQTPGSNAFGKRDGLERRQQPVQTTASPISLVDLSRATATPPALPAEQCDDATPLDLVRGVLNGKGFSVGKLLGSSNAILGALIDPPENQVNLTFAISNGLLQWNAPDVGGASFYACDEVVYAGFPNLNIAGCTEVEVGAVAGAVCVSYVTSTRSVNPDFTAPLTDSSTTSTVSAATTTASVSGSDTGAGSETSSTATASGSGNGGDSGSSSTSAASDGSASTSAGESSTSAASNGNGDNGSSTSFDTSSMSMTGTTSSASPTGSTIVSPQNCLVELPDACTSGLLGVSVGGLGLPGNLLGPASDCLAALTPQLDVTGLGNAAQCLTATVLAGSGQSLTDCLSAQLLCSNASASASATPSAGDLNCLVELPLACSAISTVDLLQLPGQLITCAGSLNQLSVSGLADATTCLAVNIIPGITSGANIVGCLNANLLCTASSTSASSTSSASPSPSSGPLCIPLPANCANLPANIGAGQLTAVATCGTDLTAALTTAFPTADLTPVTTCVTTFTNSVLAAGVAGTVPVENLFTCLIGTGLVCGT